MIWVGVAGTLSRLLLGLVIPAPAFAGVNSSPQKRGAGIHRHCHPKFRIKRGMTTCAIEVDRLLVERMEGSRFFNNHGIAFNVRWNLAAQLLCLDG